MSLYLLPPGKDSNRKMFRQKVEFVVEQREQLDTAHAVLQTVSKLKGFQGDVLVFYGDISLLKAPA